jgi:hypothetical protein
MMRKALDPERYRPLEVKGDQSKIMILGIPCETLTRKGTSTFLTFYGYGKRKKVHGSPSKKI